jgi:hypothetical protein
MPTAKGILTRLLAIFDISLVPLRLQRGCATEALLSPLQRHRHACPHVAAEKERSSGRAESNNVMASAGPVVLWCSDNVINLACQSTTNQTTLRPDLRLLQNIALELVAYRRDAARK